MTPLFEPRSAYLQAFFAAVALRSKALKYKFKKVDIATVIDTVDKVAMERADLLLSRRPTRRSSVIEVKLWEDRWAWVNAREPSKNGWLWTNTYEGRVVNGQTGREFIAAIEKFDSYIVSGTGVDIEAAGELWNKILLKGPRKP